MKNHSGSALLLVLIIMAFLVAWVGSLWRSIAYFADIAFKKQEYYQHYYETLGILHVTQLLIQQNEAFFKKTTSARKAFALPCVIQGLSAAQNDVSLTTYIRKKGDSFLITTHRDEATDCNCIMQCAISNCKKSSMLNVHDQFKIDEWGTKRK